MLQVDGGTTASYVYDALDHRVRVNTQMEQTEYLFDPFGQRQSSWAVNGNNGKEGRIFWDGRPFAFRTASSSTGGTAITGPTNYILRRDSNGSRKAFPMN